MSVQDRRQVAVDVGGTFTDCVAYRDGAIAVTKVSTTLDQSDGVIAGAAGLAEGGRFDVLVHGSTVATNALLERRGARTVLVTDAGFEDVIEIGRQDRPSLYDSFADRPTPLVEREDRIGFAGDLADTVARVAERRPEAVAVSMAYSFSDPTTEAHLGRALEGAVVSLSSEVVAEFREFERTSTTVLNAYLTPVVAGYLGHLAERSRRVAGRVEVMRSSGGLMELAEAVRLAASLLLSGPAGGVVAATALARARRFGRVVTFDMGGTSTDVCRIEAGRAEVGYERPVAGYPCRMPSVAVHTVGAGGGSIAWIDPGGSLRVGPHSAGSSPGPASYGRGGADATVTDAHLLLGRIDPAARLGGSLALDRRRAETALAVLGAAIGMDELQAAAGVVEVVEAHMERAIRSVSVEQGADPREATLVAYGGAGGLHASALARGLGMARFVIPPYGGVFSALGLLMAPPRHDTARTVMLRADQSSEFADALSAIHSSAVDTYRSTNGRPPDRTETAVDMRYVGQAHELTVATGPGDDLHAVAARFHELHLEANGFSTPADPVEAVTVRAVALGSPLMTWDDLPVLAEGPTPRPSRHEVVLDGKAAPADLWWRAGLPAGATLRGPAVIAEDVGTTVLLSGDVATVAEDGAIEVRW